MPRSLAGQMALLLGLALLVAQLANFALILNERQKLGLARNQAPAIARFVNLAADLAEAPPEFRSLVVQDNSRRGARFTLARTSAVRSDGKRESEIEERVRESLASAGVTAREVRGATASETRQRRRGNDRPARVVDLLVLSAQLGDGEWLNGRLTTPRADPFLTTRLAAATALLYLLVLGATLLIAARIARPLRDLAKAAERFGGRERPTEVIPRGPEDLRRALEAFNAMNRRVVALLDEKDHMLGAIGHDLRTPLASLRIRAESIEPEEERQRMIATIEEMHATLEDILVLARSGREREAERAMDVAALVDALVEEYRELGRAVSMEPSGRAVTTVQPNLLRRALRNLIENALKYAGSAQVAVAAADGLLSIKVADDGPGLPDDQLERVMDPFYRFEGSRSRETGGSGLGLAIARAAAESGGGSLRLANRAGGGLVATLALPIR